MIRSPRALADAYRIEFLTWLPGVRDGDAEAIHQARVATRRLREALPLLGREREDCDAAVTTARQLGRALGEARELDVLAHVLEEFELRFPAVSASAATARAALRHQQRAARRRMIKRLDGVDLEALNPNGRSGHGRLWPLRRDTAWRNQLRRRIAGLSRAVRQAIQHASGVYMPNRSHALRVAVKKLRYAVEAADAVGVWRHAEGLAELKRSQSKLGELHDVHLVRERLDDLVADDRLLPSLALLKGTLDADLDRRQRQFLALRPQLERAVLACLRQTSARDARTPILIASAAVPALLAVVGSGLGAPSSGRTSDHPAAPLPR